MTAPSTPFMSIPAAVSALQAGQIVALPTETVYGLAADAASGEAVARIYAAKGRPQFNPLIVHVFDADAAGKIAHIPTQAERLISRFWPGPLSLVVPLKPDAAVASLALAGLDTVALRSPEHPIFREVLSTLGRPLVAPSANRSGRISPTSAQDVAEEFGGDVPVVDGGQCARGIESTIVGFTADRPALLRPGALSVEDIEAVLGEPLASAGEEIAAPGMMTSHYAPNAALRLDAHRAKDSELLLGFGGTKGARLDLSPSGDLGEAAANLFAYLRSLDREGRPLAVAPIPREGLGLAINDRLQRAAAPRG